MKTTSNAQLALADRMPGDLNTENPRWHGEKTTLGVKTPAGGHVTCRFAFWIEMPNPNNHKCVRVATRDAIGALDLELTDAEQDSLYGKIEKNTELFGTSSEDVYAYCSPTGVNALLEVSITEAHSNGMVLVDVMVGFGLEVVAESLCDVGGPRTMDKHLNLERLQSYAIDEIRAATSALDRAVSAIDSISHVDFALWERLNPTTEYIGKIQKQHDKIINNLKAITHPL
jgi:hypothetical protein